jgi:hypothetical protein
MQRLLAVLLLSVIGFLPVGSAFADASVASNLPACCRALGKHHCAMPGSVSSNAGKPGLRSEADKCTHVPSVSSAAVSVSTFPSPDSRTLFQVRVCHLVASPQAAALFQIAFDRNGQKRGPPVLLS